MSPTPECFDMVHLEIRPVKLQATNDAAFRILAVPKYTAFLSNEDPLVGFSRGKSIQKVMNDRLAAEDSLPVSEQLKEEFLRRENVFFCRANQGRVLGGRARGTL
jgi:hypothetical protein